ncbi:MAG: glycosyltransferase family 4 protein [Bryobacterales bacterium]|nr:glycosyltransferase family 4 protein [Bryobacterales bacterium]
MKVLLLHRDLVFDGGVGQCFLQFARHFDRTRMELIVAGLDSAPNSLDEALEGIGVQAMTIGGGDRAGAALRLREIVAREKVALIVATSFRSYLAAKAAAFASTTRVIFWIHSIPLVMEGRMRRSLFRKLARRDTLIFVSKAVQREHDFQGRSGASHVVYNGVEDPVGSNDHEPYGRERRAELELPIEALVVGFTAELVGWKNHGVLLRAFAEIAREAPEARLLLIGSGEGCRAAKDLAKELGVADRVTFAGRRRDARKLLGLMDIYAHPANGEGFGLAVAEAMLAGRAVVGARAGALTEIIEDDRSGLLAEPDDVRSLAAALDRLAGDPGLRARLGAQARRSCLERFSPTHYAARLTEIFLAESEAVETGASAAAAH